MVRIFSPIQFLILGSIASSATAFGGTLPRASLVPSRGALQDVIVSTTAPRATVPTLLAQSDDGEPEQTDKLSALGFTESDILRSSRPSDQPEEEIKVRVDVVQDVDPVTITALGFGLIALNFLVFANLGSGGIAGIVARIINTFS
mmetsp:Transcript_9518/g.28574  ORF Transcript_9518/g.28574 Transcript_9518/m.28574 type:complete len:146 (-) Transcript_9518:580-1017(-)|eukprot:CAMPEP_0113544306 /NCGR_PEP_ID=MMETSP0015_2-20120614/10635_1 /TAXON_ID=2838 /ORGANISM="Odontella" /LENGTH=145 /DNA_ID=CAMNT_0000444551 /DNA_START=56 /DNA_END=493 /DNA_ORIENTATION=- /assembly_acc=CAM_ASM_000160